MRLHGIGLPSPLWEGEGAGAGAGGAGGQGDGQGAWTPPQGLPTEFAGKDAGESLGKLLGGYTSLNTRAEGLRTQLAQVPGPPAKPEDYTFSVDDKLKPYFGDDPSKNPILTMAKASAHKFKIPDAAFGPFIADLYGQAIEGGALQPPYDPKVEINNFGKLHGLDGTATKTALLEAETFAKGLAGQLKVPDAAKKDVEAALLALTDTAAGNTLLRALGSRLSESGFRVAGEGAGQGGPMTEADLKRLDSDPRIDPRNEFNTDPAKRYDPELRKRYDDGYAQLGKAKYAGKQ